MSGQKTNKILINAASLALMVISYIFMGKDGFIKVTSILGLIILIQLYYKWLKWNQKGLIRETIKQLGISSDF